MKLEIYSAKNLNFVELNMTGDNDNYIRCAPESVFLDSIVFNIFAPCFENANKLFDFFEATKYNSRKIIPLRNELINNLDMLEQISSVEQFKALLTKKFMGTDFLSELSKQDRNWELNWSGYLEKLKTINRQIIALTERCADEERILWVVGY